MINDDELDEAIDYASDSIDDVVLDILKASDIEFEHGDEFATIKSFLEKHIKELVAQAIIKLDMKRNDESD